ncbi:hypothetical protein SRS16CHR_01791 [Variovorax sp. SRS16]|uniref:hypothetical protein n=1 Tax=Variovorax sp. SRS16 TaxID=282217 RepID=UPI001315F25E|nr:hypothetical protein [Variovorax sp. SRS16]VTU16498.1 hypothetical protein SRS16CHR_01791 [Variovorax sp. SRS16]
MKVKYLAIVLVVASSPAWAIYKCTVEGHTSFQEQPCADARTQKDVHVQYEAPKLGSAPDAPRVQDNVAALEKERMRHEAEYALRDKQAALTNFQRRCAQEVDAIAEGRNEVNSFRAQAEASAATARATSCNTQVQALQSQVDALQRKCDGMGCKAPL